MGKLVVFKIGEGNFEQGFPVMLQIGEEGQQSVTEIAGGAMRFCEVWSKISDR